MVTLIWVFLGLLSLLLSVVILIQDSKAGGLTGAFGGGGESLLGAHGQKDLAKVTSVLAALFFLFAILGGSCAMRQQDETLVKEVPGGSTPGAAEAGTGADPNAPAGGSEPAGENVAPGTGSVTPPPSQAPPANNPTPPAGGDSGGGG